MIRPTEIVEESAARRLARVVTDQFLPAALAAGLLGAQRFGYIALVPINLVIEREYGAYALFLAAVSAFVAASAFARGARRFGVAGLLLVALLSVAMISPFPFARYGVDFGLTPMQFTLLGTFAYLGFSITVGLLIGGCWSTIVRALREPGPF